MHFIAPYILTFFSFASYGYLMAAFSFIHKDLMQIYQINKSEMGFVYGLSALGSTIGTLVFVYYTSAITKRIVKYYTWGNIGYSLSYLLVVYVSLSQQFPNKIFLYLLNFCIGYFRSFFFPSILIMIKIHKDILAHQKQNINQNSYKLLVTLWSASFDVGMIMGFFGSNFFQYSLEMHWKWLLIIGVIFNIGSIIPLYSYLKDYLQSSQNSQQPRPQQIQTTLSEHSGDHATPGFQTNLQKFFALLNQHLPNRLFLVITPLLDIMHVGFSFVLPPYFYSNGYKGSEGNLLAIYSIFVVIGAWVFGVVDWGINKLLGSENRDSKQLRKRVNQFRIPDKNQQTKKIKKMNGALRKESIDTDYFNFHHQEDEKQQSSIVFPFTSTVSLFLFSVVLILISIDVMQSPQYIEGVQVDFTKQLIYMACLGIFFGGPTKCYFSHNAIVVMSDMQKRFKQDKKRQEYRGKRYSQTILQQDQRYQQIQQQIKQMQLSSFNNIEKKTSLQQNISPEKKQIKQPLLSRPPINPIRTSSSIFLSIEFVKDLFLVRQFQISSALITINCFLFQFGTIPFVILCMVCIQVYNDLLFIFLLLLSIVLVVCDFVCALTEWRKIKDTLKQIQDSR